MTTSPTPEQINKLPKWAKDHITWLKREHATLNQQVESLGGTVKTAVELDPYRDGLVHISPINKIYLPERITVRYTLGKGGYIDTALRNGRLSVQATHLDGYMELQPTASNAFTIGFEGMRR